MLYSDYLNLIENNYNSNLSSLMEITNKEHQEGKAHFD